LGADHAGYELKETLKSYLRDVGYIIEDCGAFRLNADDDYPDFIGEAIKKLKKSLEKDADAVAIVMGGSGQGEAMVANRFHGIRAAVYYGGNADIIKLSKEHNDANVLSLGARFISAQEAKEAVSLWLKTVFSGEERHKRRLKKIHALYKGI